MTSRCRLQSRVVVGAGDGPHLLISAGVHGDEFEGMAAVRRLIRALPTMSLQGKVTLVPIVNEPAFLRGQRTADDGLDLARQCPGDAAGTITQQIAHELTLLIRAADYYIDLHSGGTAMCVAPLAGYVLHADARVLDAQRRMARAFNLPLVWGTAADLDGRSLSVARDAGVPAIYAEYLGSGVCNTQGVEDYYEGCLNVLGELGMIRRPPPPSRFERTVEDARAGSGHLQVSHPAPMTGCFESAVALHQEVRAGQLLGRVVSPLGDEIREVVAEHSGTVICLTTFPRVTEGSGLAVILECESNDTIADS